MRNYDWSENGISELVGRTITTLEVIRDQIKEDDCVRFHCADGDVFEMIHLQDCCETVTLDDIAGDVSDLVGEPVILAEERAHDAPKKDEYDDSHSWTFYVIATRKGYVHFKWYGTSNGYYGEKADFLKLEKAN